MSKYDEQAARVARLREQLETAKVELRSAIDDDATSDADLDATVDEVNDLQTKVDAAEERANKLRDIEVSLTRAAEKPAPKVDRVVEPDLYAPNSNRSWVYDQIRSNKGDITASDRLRRFSEAHETRDVGTSAFGALVVPQFLTELYAEVVRAGMPWCAASSQENLPNDGMVLNIPRGTTGTSAAAQASENAAVSETNFDETTLAINVRTFAGQQDISRQSIERGTNVDRIIFADLASAYATAVDASAIGADGTSGTHLGVLSTAGINSVTYTDATPTVAELYPKLADAVQQIQSNRFAAPDAIFMHPRRWAFLLANVDASARPIIVPNGNGPQNAAGLLSSNGYGVVVGTLLGLNVYTDANIPTNLGGDTDEDAIIVARMADSHFFSDEAAAPRSLTFEETAGGNLTVKAVVYGYSAYTAGRYPTAFSVISGTGLVAPTF